MSPLDFNQCTLYISARSPFARRVRLAFLESGISFEQKVLNVFEPQPELSSLNPLARVPVAKLKNGEVLIDSNLILQEFYRNHESALMPKNISDRLLCSKWMAIGSGLCEKMVEYFLEHQRAEKLRDAELVTEIKGIFKRTLDNFSALIGESTTIVKGQMTQGDLDMGAALAYASLRYSSDWEKSHPNVSRYFNGLNQRASFQQTLPPLM